MASPDSTVAFSEAVSRRSATWKPGEEPAIYVGLEHIAAYQLRLLGTGSSDEVASSKTRFESGDVLFGKLRPYFRKVVRPKFSGICSSDIWALYPKDPSLLDASYLHWVVADPLFSDFANSAETGTRMPRASWQWVGEYRIPLPPLDEQQRISEVLNAIDERSRVLLSMAELTWAVLRTKFDIAFDESVAVQTTTVGDQVKLRGGGTPSTKEPGYWEPATQAWATPKDLSGKSVPVLTETERFLSADGVKKIASGILPRGTFLMSSRAPIGYLAIADVSVAINQGFIAVTPGGGMHPLELLCWTAQNLEVIQARAGGSTFPEISKASFAGMELSLPSQAVRDAFVTDAVVLYEAMAQCVRERATLARLQEFLLPRLVSGELRVREAEELVQEAT